MCDPATGAASIVCSESCGACHYFCEGNGDGIFLGVEQDCQRLVATNSQIHKEVCFQLERGIGRTVLVAKNNKSK